MGKLEYIRRAVDQGYTWPQVAQTYGTLQYSFLEVNNSVGDAVGDQRVAAELRTVAALGAYKGAQATRGSLLLGGLESGGTLADEPHGLLTGATEESETQLAIFETTADPQRKGQVRDALVNSSLAAVERKADVALARQDGGGSGADAATEVTEVLATLHGIESGAFGEVIGAAGESRAGAERASNLFLLAAALSVVAATVGALLLGRRITKPLDDLTEAADDLSSVQMPRLVESLRNPTDDELDAGLADMVPIDISSKDEIGQLATSFNEVQRVAGEVAAEQAQLLRKGIGEMFVNLARRNQALLDRQIEFIDELERGEEDAEQLENLYHLDHLATRMRRNAESLLVLAGAEPARRRGRPAPLANVVRAALAEVEDFARIELVSFDEVLVASNAAADLAHLLSELMENATNFSPPGSQVEVIGHRTKADGYVISITDHGIGMSADQISTANETLARPPIVGLAMSRSLGFIVVGRLARRHGVAVRLMPAPAGGISAVVSIPPKLVTDAVGRTMGAAGATGLAAPPAPPAEVRAPSAPPKPAEVSELRPRPNPFEAPPSTDGQPATDQPSAPLAPVAFSPPGTAGAPPAGPDKTPGETFAEPAPFEPPSGVPSTPSGLPTRRLQSSPRPNQISAQQPRVSRPTDLPARGEPGPAAPSSPDVALPEPVSFLRPEESVGSRPSGPAEVSTGPNGSSEGRLDGPPPMAPPLPSRDSRPPAPPTSVPQMAASSDGGPPRLFGQAPSAPTEPTAPPLARRGSPPSGGEAGAPPPAAPAQSEPPSGADPGAGEARTASGLVRRTPRQAGAARPMPGADGERGVGASRRSPDEVRNLLSRYRAGQQRARVEDAPPSVPNEETKPND